MSVSTSLFELWRRLPENAFRKDGFVRHASLFVEETAESESILREIHQLRNAAEPLRGLDARALPNVSPGDREAIAMRRTRQAESLALSVYRKLFRARSGYLERFRTNESIRRFWAERPWVRRSVWGATLKLENVD